MRHWRICVDGSDYTLAGNFNEEGTHGGISPLVSRWGEPSG